MSRETGRGETQLTCWRRCPKSTPDKQRISFIASEKLPDNFWRDLFDKKCPEGLGEVSANLKNGGFLRAEDFCAPDKNTSHNQLDGHGKEISNSYARREDADGSATFKTPSTKRRQNIAQTPCLFSQVETSPCSQVIDTADLLNTPTSAPQNCDHPMSCGAGLGSPDLDDSVFCDAGSGNQSSQGLPQPFLTKTGSPDILDIMSSQKPPVRNLSCLLSDDANDDAPVWSDSMATPPLERDEEVAESKVMEVDADTKCDGNEEQMPHKPVARVLFSRGTASDSTSDASMTSLKTLEETDVTGVESGKSPDDSSVGSTTNGEVTLVPEPLGLQGDTPQESPRSVRTLAHSTPKPGSFAQHEASSLLVTPVARARTSPIRSGMLDGAWHEADVSNENLFTSSVAEGTSADAAGDWASVPDAGHVDTSDVEYGSLSQSFEQAMALEVEKLNRLVETTTGPAGSGGCKRDAGGDSLRRNGEDFQESNAPRNSASPLMRHALWKESPTGDVPRPLQDPGASPPGRTPPMRAPDRVPEVTRFPYPVSERTYKDGIEHRSPDEVVHELGLSKTTETAKSCREHNLDQEEEILASLAFPSDQDASSTDRDLEQGEEILASVTLPSDQRWSSTDRDLEQGEEVLASVTLSSDQHASSTDHDLEQEEEVLASVILPSDQQPACVTCREETSHTASLIEGCLQSDGESRTSGEADREVDAVAAATETNLRVDRAEKTLTSGLDKGGVKTAEERLCFGNVQGDPATVLSVRTRRSRSKGDFPHPKRLKLERQAGNAERDQAESGNCALTECTRPVCAVSVDGETPVDKPGSALLVGTSEIRMSVARDSSEKAPLDTSTSAAQNIDAAGTSELGNNPASAVEGKTVEHENLVDMDQLTQFPFECLSPPMRPSVPLEELARQDKSCEQDSHNELPFAGFRTASGKEVSISEEALSKARTTMHKIDQDLVNLAVQERRGTEDLAANKIGNNAEGVNEYETSPVEQDLHCTARKDGNVESSGFQSADEEPMTISEGAMKKDQGNIGRIEEDLHCNVSNGLLDSAACFDGALQKPNKTMDQVKQHLNPINVLSIEDQGSTSFRTAGGNQVDISEEALKKAGNTIQEIDKELHYSKQTVGNQRFTGFQTAGGKKVDISEEALKKARKTMDQIDEDLHNGKPSGGNQGFTGFQTAGGKKVDISEDALKKARKTMDQIEEDLHDNIPSGGNQGFTGFQTAGGKKVDISEEALKKARKTMDQIDEDLHNGKPSGGNQGFTGFQTAGGKKVDISEEALKKARKTIQEIDKDLHNSKQTVGNQRFTGFQTAGGNKVDISEEALKKARKTMDQIDKDLHNKMPSGRNQGFTGFQTAGGKKVDISEEALKKARKTMDQIEEDLHNKMPSGGNQEFTGFQTAGGKKVDISEEAQKKARNTMDQIDEDLHNKMPSGGNQGFTGFQTAGGKKVDISEEALKKARKTMDQIDEDLHNKMPSGGNQGFTGFQTAGGKKVDISEEALKKARKTLDQIDEDLHNKTPSGGNQGFTGFQTTGGKKVDISEEALKKARKAMDQVDEDDESANTEGCRYKHDNGMETSQSKLSIQALEKAWASLDDIDRMACQTNPPKNVTYLDNKPRLASGQSETGTSRRAEALPRELRASSVALGSCDDTVSREVLESSKALLADDSFQDFISDHDCTSTSTPCSAAITPQAHRAARSYAHRRVLSAVHPGHNSETNESRTQSRQRLGMEPVKSTPTGVLRDRRSSKRLLTPRTINCDDSLSREITNGSRINSRSLTALRSSGQSSPAQFNTPLNSRSAGPDPQKATTPFGSTAGRIARVARPHFSTPYRQSGVFGARNSSEGSSLGSEAPSAKKPRLSAPSGLLETDHTGAPLKFEIKGSGRVRPRLGFLSRLRLHQPRISLLQYVGDTRPAQHSAGELRSFGVSDEVLAVTCSNAASFRFDGTKYFSDSIRSANQGTRTEDGGMMRLASDGRLGLEEIQSAFLATPGVERGLISDDWLENHFRWIVWKLAAMEVAFPAHFAGRCLTPNWVMCQLKYRYDREIDRSQRSLLRKILERDDVSTRTMVLCISGVCDAGDAAQQDGVSPGVHAAQKRQEPPCEKPTVIQVTDGWYGTRALLDRPLARLLAQGRIRVGQKLCIYGADLIGSDQAVSPLEAPSSLMLRLHANSTRRARWDAKLGLQRHAHAFPLKLASIFPDGGLVGCVDVVVQRQYPLQWMEKMPDGSHVFRSPRVEERAAQRFDQERLRRRETLFLRVEREFEKESSRSEQSRKRQRKVSRRSFTARDIEALRDGKEIHDALSVTTDPDVLMGALDGEQRDLLDTYTRSYHEERRMELQAKFEQAWRGQEEHQTERNVVPLLKVRVADYCKDGEGTKSALLSVWRSTKDVMSLLSEGARLKIHNTTASAGRHRHGTSEIQLSATRTTRYQVLPVDPDVKCRVYTERKTASFETLNLKAIRLNAEVDLVGLVVLCNPQTHSSLQTVYLADEQQNFVAIKFWGGLEAHALEGLVKPRCLVASSNLVRSEDHLTFPCLTFGDLSSLTLRPRDSYLRTALESLQSSIKTLDVFMAEAQERLNRVLAKRFPMTSRKIESRSDAETPANRTDTGDSPVSKALNATRDSTKLSAPGPLSRGMKSRQCKRKLLESISLSPLTCSVSAGARKGFKRPKQEHAGTEQ